MKQVDSYVSRLIREHKSCKTGWPTWKLMPISKCWIGYATAKYVIWWGHSILDHCDTYKEAIKRRREIYNAA